MSHYQKCCYLVNTHQASDFSDAAKKIKAANPPKPKKVANPEPRQIRLPYRDD